MAGLTTYNVTPTINANPGYTQFSLDNLNYQQFMKAIREPVPAAITNSFKESPYWPEGLRNVIYYQSLRPTLQSIAFIDGRRKSICSHPTSTFQYSLCAAIERNIDEYSDRCSAHFTDIQVRLREFQDGQSFFNTAVTYCHFSRFKIFMNEIRLVRQKFCEVYSLSAPAPPGCAGVTVTVRSALQMIEFLGEIIAAQNFIDLPFMPTVIIGISTPRGSFEFVDVPLFVVKRGGLAAEPVAISVSQNGVTYYIPQPDVGSPVEERSLQTLDLVLQSLRAASFREDMPKVPTFGVVTK